MRLSDWFKATWLWTVETGSKSELQTSETILLSEATSLFHDQGEGRASRSSHNWTRPLSHGTPSSTAPVKVLLEGCEYPYSELLGLRQMGPLSCSWPLSLGPSPGEITLLPISTQFTALRVTGLRARLQIPLRRCPQITAPPGMGSSLG